MKLIIEPCFNFPFNTIFEGAAVLQEKSWTWRSTLDNSLGRSLSYKNQSINLLYKSVDWFLYDRDLPMKELITEDGVVNFNYRLWLFNPMPVFYLNRYDPVTISQFFSL